MCTSRSSKPAASALFTMGPINGPPLPAYTSTEAFSAARTWSVYEGSCSTLLPNPAWAAFGAGTGFQLSRYRTM